MLWLLGARFLYNFCSQRAFGAASKLHCWRQYCFCASNKRKPAPNKQPECITVLVEWEWGISPCRKKISSLKTSKSVFGGEGGCNVTMWGGQGMQWWRPFQLPQQSIMIRIFFVNTYGFQIFIDRCVLYNTEILERRAALPRSSVKGQLVCASSDPVYPELVTFQSYTIYNKLTVHGG